MRERRNYERVPAFVAGRVGYGGRYRLRCLIANVSGAGAKLSFEKCAPLPERFTLAVTRDGARSLYCATVKWRSRLAVGVALCEGAEAEPLFGLAAA